MNALFKITIEKSPRWDPLLLLLWRFFYSYYKFLALDAYKFVSFLPHNFVHTSSSCKKKKRQNHASCGTWTSLSARRRLCQEDKHGKNYVSGVSLSLALLPKPNGNSSKSSRRSCLRKTLMTGTVATGALFMLPQRVHHHVVNYATAPNYDNTANRRRENFPISSSSPLSFTDDIIHPQIFAGRWECERAMARIEGDQLEAELSWKTLGGDGGLGGGDESFGIENDKIMRHFQL